MGRVRGADLCRSGMQSNTVRIVRLARVYCTIVTIPQAPESALHSKAEAHEVIKLMIRRSSSRHCERNLANGLLERVVPLCGDDLCRLLEIPPNRHRQVHAN